MGVNLYHKKYVEKMIKKNPAEIKVTRTILKDTGRGGKKKEVINLDPQTVTIYNKKSQRERINDSGEVIGYMASSIERLLAKHDADIEEGDTFINGHRKYKVTFVNNYMDIYKQAELEVIENV